MVQPLSPDGLTEHALRERVKELTLLHDAARLLNARGEPKAILKSVLELLPRGWQYPDLAVARIQFAELEVLTSTSAASACALRAEFEVGSERGFIEVGYEPDPESGTAPAFLAEEQKVIESLAELLESYFARLRAEAMQLELTRAQAAEGAALAANRARGEFLGTVAHDLRTSLHVMHGWIQMLKKGELSQEKSSRALQILERNAALQKKLIDDLLDLSRIDAGKLRIERHPIDLRELVSFAVDATRPVADAKRLALVVELEHTGSVLGDQQRLQQVIYNLLNNAVKFTPEGGRIEVQLVKVGTMAQVTVRDSGIGIEPALLPHIFERFRQADRPNPANRSGLGLGLSIAHHLVELHQGSMTASSGGPGKGATFELQLPLQAALPVAGA